MKRLLRYPLTPRSYLAYQRGLEFCKSEDVAELEAINAEMLEALKKALDALGGNDPHDLNYDDSICGYIRSAITNAKGVQP